MWPGSDRGRASATPNVSTPQCVIKCEMLTHSCAVVVERKHARHKENRPCPFFLRVILFPQSQTVRRVDFLRGRFTTTEVQSSINRRTTSAKCTCSLNFTVSSDSYTPILAVTQLSANSWASANKERHSDSNQLTLCD